MNNIKTVFDYFFCNKNISDEMKIHYKLRNCVVGCLMCGCEILPPSIYYICSECEDGLHTVCPSCYPYAKEQKGHKFYSELLPFCRDNSVIKTVTSFSSKLITLFNLYKERKCLGYRWISDQLMNHFEWISYQDVFELCCGLCEKIQLMNIEINEPILICGDSCIDSYIISFSVAIGGYLWVPINHTSTKEYVHGIMNRCKIRLAFISKNNIGYLEEELKSVEKIILIDDCPEAYSTIISPQHQYPTVMSIIKKSKTLPKPLICNPNTPRLLLSTSGSTGNPKLVIMNEQTLRNSLQPSQPNLQVITITSSLIRQPYDIINKGGSIACYSGSMERLREDIIMVRPTFFGATPTFWYSLYQEFLFETKGLKEQEAIELYKKKRVLGNRCKSVLITGAKSSEEIKTFLFKIGLIVTDGYGTSETGSLINMSTGKVNDGVELKLIDCPEMGYFVNSIPSRGEVIAKTRKMSSGYYGDEQLTNEMFINIEGSIYFKTGDIGEIVDGQIKIIDRKAFCFKTPQGCFVTPTVIENKLSKIEGIEQIVIFNGINDQVTAVLTLKENDIEKDVFKLIKTNSIKEGLKEYEIPQQIIIAKEHFTVKNGMLTLNGKINRNKIIKHYKPLSSSHQIIIKETQTEENIEQNDVSIKQIPIISKQLEEILRNSIKNIKYIKNINEIVEYRITDFGVDSIIMTQISQLIKKTFNIEINTRLLYKFRSIEQLQNYLNGMPLIEEEILWEDEIKQAIRTEHQIQFNQHKNKNKILLFGCNGFVGKFILRELIGKEVICIVRGNNYQEKVLSSFKETIHCINNKKDYEIWFNTHVQIIQGEVSEQNFGLSEKIYNELLQSVSIVILSSGKTHMMENYQMLYSSNVLSVSHVIEFCQRNSSFLFDVSSLSVLSGSQILNEEIDIPLTHINLLNGYAQSKLIAEKAIIGSKGFKKCILRLGTAGPDRYSGVCNTLSKYIQMISQILIHKKVSYSTSNLYQLIPFIPVDYFSSSLRSLIDHCNEMNEITCFHFGCESLSSLKQLLSVEHLEEVDEIDYWQTEGISNEFKSLPSIENTIKLNGHIPLYSPEECKLFLKWIKEHY
ncbi:acyl-CoA synthetase, putative [Entamoeba histolytica HM-1:IMSS-B]|uniref:Acyl-CoA synthetase, putative n=4 Tax=Entamoeba histolytica TaxID=5759 RepID=C4LX21_ENTH1|nr:acyl-CoA synthetase, putative [Entamoeba histolytica HM-1:IMSS]EAL43438.2 acyl-CoA synthetase, putative [Entamoeba histolytica HM-1:IMSS]EMH75811.1 acyl-CoA synthetase, putative [Entamoeba histolytica HM-1:IMSS-B]ENY61176.1 acyl-CoA synthetase, putative [Entamoeba histolytica HM-1:IMSS-A]GAT93273.1 acyl-coa synthetase putative [Entamoeba histolytica]|eukprot:XP_648826.2 acyl-CoA synthetase, putative [Entamoeba histolytica HM-1:IMSS]